MTATTAEAGAARGVPGRPAFTTVTTTSTKEAAA